MTLSSLRTATAHGELAYVRIAGRIYTTLAAIAAMTECRRFSAGRMSEEAWNAHLATLLKKHRRGG
ncbi:hypothetical protein ACVWZM_004094 [Bradyrhizobium sp. USDA 4501]